MSQRLGLASFGLVQGDTVCIEIALRYADKTSWEMPTTMATLTEKFKGSFKQQELDPLKAVHISSLPKMVMWKSALPSYV